MADKLSIFKGALRLLGPHELATLTDNRPERFQLDDAWSDAVALHLGEGLWNFATRTVEIAASGSPIPGWDYAFTKPADYVRTAGIADEPTFRNGFEDYEDQGGKWYASIDPIYVRYVSNDDAFGMNVAAWPQSFVFALEALLAFQTGLPVSGDKGNRNDLYSLYKERLKRAKTLDAFNESVKQSPPGRLVRARLSGYRGKDG